MLPFHTFFCSSNHNSLLHMKQIWSYYKVLIIFYFFTSGRSIFLLLLLHKIYELIKNKINEVKHEVEKLINLGSNYQLNSKFYFIFTSFFLFIKLGLC